MRWSDPSAGACGSPHSTAPACGSCDGRATTSDIPSSFSIYDTDDSRRLLTDIGKDLDLDPRKYRPRGLQHQISGLKNELIDHEAFAAGVETESQQVLADVYRQYTERLQRAGAMDFDDLIGNSVAVLTLFDEVGVLLPPDVRAHPHR